MNKLTSLMASAVGKKSQYDEVREATLGGRAASPTGPGQPESRTVEEEPLSRRSVAQHMSIEESEGRLGSIRVGQFFSSLLGRNGLAVFLAVCLGAFFAWSGERVSRTNRFHHLHQKEEEQQSLMDSQTLYRPCVSFHSTSSDSQGVKKIRVLQTSLGQPSAQWSLVPCATGQTKQSSFFNSKEIPLIREYLVPDASIQLDFNPGNNYKQRTVPIMGFGGAFTEAAALNYKSLSDKGKRTVMELLFGKDGLGYSLTRVHMNSCDFCVKSYDFASTDGDFDLEDFDTEVAHDSDSGMIDMMLTATSLVREGWPNEEKNGGGMKIIVSPWSPPAWMKAPTKEDKKGALHAENMTDSAEPSCLRDGTGPDSKYAKAWALYFGKFITAYKDLGVNLFGVTVQNEPEFPAPWEACAYNPWTEQDFIAHHLGPMLRETHPDVKLMMFDHNKDHAPFWASVLLDASSPAAEFIDGTAVHWYAGGMDRLLDGAQGSPNMHRLISDLKRMGVKNDHIVFGSEACHCPTTGYAGGDLTVAWARAERYAHTVLADLATGSNGWIEWNLLLDSIGGPNHLGNLCDAPVLAVPYRAKGASDIPDQESFESQGHPFGPVIGDQRTREELNAMGFAAEYIDAGIIVQPMYYYMGHISRHVRPGSKPVKALVGGTEEGRNGRYFRPEGQLVAGGGMNDLARTGIELTTWPCEGSTRQQFALNDNGQLAVYGHDWLGKPTTSCVGKTPDESFEGLLLAECDTDAGVFSLQAPTSPSDSSANLVNIVMKNGSADAKKSCLVIRPLSNDGGAYGPRGGAQVAVGSCSSLASEWIFDEDAGEFSSQFFSGEGEVCLTTGWPFLQVGAFDTPNAEDTKAVVVLNEAGEPANYVLKDGEKVLMTSSIPAHSIQTVLFD